MNEPRFQIAVIRGDGIGVDVTDAALAAVAAARVRIPRGMEAAVAIIPRCSADVIALLPGRAGG